MVSISSARAEALVSSRTTRRDTTMLPRTLSIFKIWNGWEMPINGVMSLIGRISICEPGRNAMAPLRSTVKPPLTRPKITPFTLSLLFIIFSRSCHTSSRRAFSRDRTMLPSLSSYLSTKTSTTSPTFNSSFLPNSRKGMRPSDFKPTSTVAKSSVKRMIVPFMTVPTMPLPPNCSFSRSSKFSVISGILISAVFAIIFYFQKMPDPRLEADLCILKTFFMLHRIENCLLF